MSTANAKVLDEHNLMNFWLGRDVGPDGQQQPAFNMAPPNPPASTVGPDGLPFPPQPVDGLTANAPPPFLTKTYDMVDDPATDHVVSWSRTNNSFVVWNPPEFARDLLPKYFKHNNFSSFVRQLNTYGFRKVDPDRWEFANEGFLRGQKHLLKKIHRRKPSGAGAASATLANQAAPPTINQFPQGFGQAAQQGPGQQAVEVGKFGLADEVERLKRDKNVLMLELVRLRQQQAVTEREVNHMAGRLSVAEQRQQQMMAFLAKAVQNPSLLAQLVQSNEKTQRLTGRKKRRLPGRDRGADVDSVNSGGSLNSLGSEQDQAQQGAAIVKYHPGQEQARPSFSQRFSPGRGASSPQTEASHGSPPNNDPVDPLLVGSPSIPAAVAPEALPLLSNMQQHSSSGGQPQVPDSVFKGSAAQSMSPMMQQHNSPARAGGSMGGLLPGMQRSGGMDPRFSQQFMQQQQAAQRMGIQSGYTGNINSSPGLSGLPQNGMGMPPMMNGVGLGAPGVPDNFQTADPAQSTGGAPSSLSFPGANDVFWEQLLSAQGTVPPPGVSSVNLDALASDGNLEHGDEASSAQAQAERWWTERAQMERLAEQMGQLGAAAAQQR